MSLTIGWVVSTEQFASVCMEKLHTDAGRCVAVAPGIYQVDSLGLRVGIEIKSKSPGGFCRSLRPNSLGFS